SLLFSLMHRPPPRSTLFPYTTLFRSDDDRHPHAQLLHGADHALREHVAAQDAAEDVDEDGPHVPVRREDLERIADLFRVGAATDVEEIRRLAARQLDDVHRRHREAGAVHHAADVAVEMDVVQRELRRLDLELIFFAEI